MTGCSPAWAAQAYEGFWASTKKGCRDQDSANRMSIEGGNRLYWYETRCKASDIKSDGERAWMMQRMRRRGRKVPVQAAGLDRDRRLAGDGQRACRSGQTPYVRCDGPKAR